MLLLPWPTVAVAHVKTTMLCHCAVFAVDQVDWFGKYSRSLATYMQSIGDSGIDLTQVSTVMFTVFIM